MMRQRSLMFLLLFLAGQLHAQELEEKNFDHYTVASGMSHNIISGIRQDSVGYIWIGTASGLNCFNGSRFLQFHSNNDSLSMASEMVSGMSWLGKNQLGVHSSGLHIVNTRTGARRNIFIPYHNRQYQFKFNLIERSMGDEAGNIYVLSRGGFYHYDSNDSLVSRFDFYSEEDVPVSHFFFGRELFQLDEKRLLIASLVGLYIYDKQKRKVKKLEAADCPALAEFINYPPNNYIILQHKPGHLFVLKVLTDSLVYVNTIQNRKVVSRLPLDSLRMEFAYRTRLIAVNDTLLYITGHMSGFFKMSFNPTSGYVKLHPQKYFKQYLCHILYKDKEDHLWIGTNKGVFRQNPERSSVQVSLLPAAVEDSFPNIRIDDVVVTGDKVFVTTRADGGLIEFDKQTLELRKQIIFKKYGRFGNNIPAAVVVNPRTLLLGTDGPLLLFDQSSRKETVLLPPGWKAAFWTNDLFKDRKGNIWIGSFNVYRYNPVAKDFLMIRKIHYLHRVPVAMQEDREGNLWMAGHGLARYNVALDSIDLVLDSFPYTKMPDKQVNALMIDDQNKVWFNSANNGLISYEIDKKTFRQFTRNDGLPDNNIASLTIVGHHLWIACLTGVACMDLRTSQIFSFGKDDGFPEMPIVRGARFFYDSTEKQLYIAQSNAVVRFKPQDILSKKSPPHMFIESLVVNDGKTIFLPGESITTSWKDKEIRITIGTINFSDGSSQRFAYRILKDQKTPWIQTGSQPSFNISSLSPGTYRIQVKAFSPSNRWTEQVKEMTIKVLPPLWGEKWFRLLAILAALLLIYLLIKWRTHLARRKEMVKTHLEKLKADDYKNQFELEQISNYFSSSLTDKKTESEVLWDVTRNLIGRMNYEDCMIYLWNEDKTKMVQKAAYGPKGKPEIIASHVFEVLPGQGIVGYVVETRQPVLLNDTRKDGRYRVDDNFRLSEVCVPIIHNDELLGIIDSEHHQPAYFSERDIKILTTIATLIGNKLKQIESERSLDAKRKELATINEQLAEARLSALQAQMNPHFVFNALNSIKRMILDGDNERASRYLSKFALMIRMTLNHSREIFVTLDENVEYLRTYLDMERLRFDDSFKYCISIGDNIEVAETPIPSMMMQPIVENAIWHGLMQSGPDKKIMICFTQEDNRLTCLVEDNGIGIRQSEKMKEKNKPPHQSVGLENLRKRIKIMNEKYEMDCSIRIIDLGETENKNGTRVVLQFNLINV